MRTMLTSLKTVIYHFVVGKNKQRKGGQHMKIGDKLYQYAYVQMAGELWAGRKGYTREQNENHDCLRAKPRRH